MAHKPGRHAFDPVTEADKGAERAIRDIIERERPDDGILGEEYGEKQGKNGLRWVLDPVDGTRAFITGRHEWGSLIALEENGVPVLGILDQPVLGERFIGVNGRAVCCRARGARRSRCAPAPTSKTPSSAPPIRLLILRPGSRPLSPACSDAVRMTRYGGDCYLFAALALGFVDIIIEAGFNRWDVAALIPLVEGAGGIITILGRRDCRDGKTILACGDNRVHEEAIKLLKS